MFVQIYILSSHFWQYTMITGHSLGEIVLTAQPHKSKYKLMKILIS